MHFVRRPFQFPAELSSVLSRFFWQKLEPNSADLRSLSAALAALWPALAKQRGQELTGSKSQHYSMTAQAVRAYGAYYLPANVMKIPLLLEEMHWLGLSKYLFAQGQSTRWLDLGVGPGTLFWGISWWAKFRNVAFEYTGLEQSKQFCSLAAELAILLQNELQNRNTAKAQFINADLAKGISAELNRLDPTVVSMMNCIAEIEPNVQRRQSWFLGLLDQLAAMSKKTGEPRWVVIVEPGSQNSSRELLGLRELLRQRKDVRIWLPCFDARPCGALIKPTDWCHEEASIEFPQWMADLGAAAQLKKESVLFSYLVVSVGGDFSNFAWPSSASRVVSQMMRQKGLSECFMCTQNGRVRARLLNSKVTPETEAFQSAVRGQSYSVFEYDEKGSVESFQEVVGECEPELDERLFPRL